MTEVGLALQQKREVCAGPRSTATAETEETFSRGFSGEKMFELFFLKWRISVNFFIFERRRGPQTYPPYPTHSTVLRLRWWTADGGWLLADEERNDTERNEWSVLDRQAETESRTARPWRPFQSRVVNWFRTTTTDRPTDRWRSSSRQPGRPSG